MRFRATANLCSGAQSPIGPVPITPAVPQVFRAFKKNMNDFIQPQKLSRLNVAGVTIARVMCGTFHAIPLNGMDNCNKDAHPLAPLSRLKYTNREAEPLWWNVLGTKDVSPRCIRARSINRLRVAFKDALARNGYDAKGFKLPESHGTGIKPPRGNLEGTVAFMINHETIKASWSEITAQADKMLEHIIKKFHGPARKNVQNDRLEKPAGRLYHNKHHRVR